MPASLDLHTPTVATVDPRGLAIRTTRYLRSVLGGPAEPLADRMRRNLAGRITTEWDARLWKRAEADSTFRPNSRQQSHLTGIPCGVDSVDMGWRRRLADATGRTRLTWDGRGTRGTIVYDNQGRITAQFEQGHGKPLRCIERATYGGPEAVRLNGAGRVIRRDDSAGALRHGAFDLHGGIVSQSQQFLPTTGDPDWPENLAARDAMLAPDEYLTHWTRDATGAVLHQTDASGHRQVFYFGVDGELAQCRLLLASGTGHVLVHGMERDASGRMTRQQTGNGVTTTVHYDEQSNRLACLRADSGDHTPLQVLRYGYDPVGNVVSTEDALAVPRYWNGWRSDGLAVFGYDSLYRLIEASGRENPANMIGPVVPPISDLALLTPYREIYGYDSAGNLLSLRHQGESGYTRRMAVDYRSNRSLFCPGSEQEPDFDMAFDKNGNQRGLQRGLSLNWDGRNQLRRCTLVARAGGIPDEEFYVYTGDGVRCRKLTDRVINGVSQRNEVRYLPGLEQRQSTVCNERWDVVIVHAGLCGARVLIWRTGRPCGIPDEQVRYQHVDHLGSVSLEVDEHARIISRQGYYPYGGIAWQSARSELEVGYAITRYSGKEQDASGLLYYGVRYYAPWFQRWISPDPGGTIDGLNMYTMLRCNPVSFVDATGFAPDKREVRSLSKAHYEQFIAPRILEREDTDREAAIKTMVELVGQSFSGELLEGVVKKLRSSSMTFNIGAGKLSTFRGESLRNRWEPGSEYGESYRIIRDHAESNFFGYADSPIAQVRLYGAVIDGKGFRSQYRPTYGAVDFNNGTSRRPKTSGQGVKVGGAPDYGDTALVLSAAQTGYLTFTGYDSLETGSDYQKGRLAPAGHASDLLGSMDNPYPVIVHMDRTMLKGVISGVQTGSFVDVTRYVEWQSHSVLKWRDFSHMVVGVDESHMHFAMAKKFARKHGLTVRQPGYPV